MTTRERLDTAVQRVADTLGHDVCWLHRGAYHFRLSADATIAVSADSAERVRLDSCRGTVPQATVWVLPGDDDRLVSAVTEMVRAAQVTA